MSDALIPVKRDVVSLQRGIATVVKDPESIMPYGFNLSEWLNVGETISSCTVELVGIDALDVDTAGDPIVLLTGDTSGDFEASVWLKNGADGAVATFAFMTTDGRIDVRRLRFLIQQR